jgi:hypothetical protein
MSIYVIDSNFLIQAHRATYPLDVALSFWNKVKQLADEGKIISIDKVQNEIYDKNDELESWCTDNLPDTFFRESSESLTAYASVVSWAVSKSNHYMPKALNEFLDGDEADAFLIAFALMDSYERIIVTQEISQPEIKRKIKIPEACNDLNVSFINVMDMFRQLGEVF